MNDPHRLMLVNALLNMASVVVSPRWVQLDLGVYSLTSSAYSSPRSLPLLMEAIRSRCRPFQNASPLDRASKVLKLSKILHLAPVQWQALARFFRGWQSIVRALTY